MTINKVSFVLDHSDLKCDLCGSPHIIETTSGYVCGECAVELKMKKLQYDRPYDDQLLQHGRGLGKTLIGNRRERAISPDSRRLMRLNKKNMQLTSEETAKQKARIEISRILEQLGIPNKLLSYILDKFDLVREKLTPGSKYRSPEKLAAVLTYLSFKVENIVVDKAQLLSTVALEEKEFNSFLIQTARHLPEYMNRNRQKYISQKLYEVTVHFGLDSSFYFLSREILNKLWDCIKNTTDNVITGLCASITTLCNYKDEITINSICKFLDIKMSTIQFQVKKRIFESFKVPGFSTLIGSANLLKGFMKKIGLIEEDEPKIEVVTEEDGIIQVQLGNACQIFNPNNDYYLIGTSEEIGNTTLVYLEVYRISYDRKFLKKPRKNVVPWFDATLGEYITGKGPPP